MGIYLRREVPPSLAGDDQQQAAAASEHLNGKYMDKRINVTAWFKMFVYLVHPEDVNCGVGTDGAGPDPQINNKCYVLESRPDSFRHNQSWGWRSQKLFNDIFSSTRGSNTNVRCCVVMGLV